MKRTHIQVILGILLLVVQACGNPPAPDDRAASVDGVEIAYSVTGTGSPALVFVHGWTLQIPEKVIFQLS